MTSFWDWSNEVYARDGAAPLLLRLQDRHALNVNLLLWCIWCASSKEDLADALLLKGAEIAARWESDIVKPVRTARRALKSPPASVPADAAQKLYEHLKDAELRAEKIVQLVLEQLARDHVDPAAEPIRRADRARRNLAAYVRREGAAQTAGFSISLLEDLIGLTLRTPESGGEQEIGQVG